MNHLSGHAVFVRRKTQSISCSQSSKIISAVDGLLDRGALSKFEDHLKVCLDCQKQKQEVLLCLKSINNLIPNHQLSQSEHEDINREVAEVFKYVSTKIDRSSLTFFQRCVINLKSIEKTLSSIIFSKDMVKYYMISVVMGLTLRIFLKST